MSKWVYYVIVSNEGDEMGHLVKRNTFKEMAAERDKLKKVYDNVSFIGRRKRMKFDS